MMVGTGESPENRLGYQCGELAPRKQLQPRIDRNEWVNTPAASLFRRNYSEAHSIQSVSGPQWDKT